MSDALKKASTGDDGKQYFVPSTYYPWAIFYRKSVWAEKGYTPPKTLDELKTLGAKMQQDQLIPIAFADKDGWPAMGTFDQLNLRINGYDFHVSLMAGKEDWSGDKVKKVFDTWKRPSPPSTRPTPSGGPGRRRLRRCSRRRPACTCWAPSSRQQFTKRCGTGRPRLLHLPRGRLDHRHRRGSKRPSTDT